MKFSQYLYFSLLIPSAASPIYATVPTHNLTHDQQENTLLRCKSHEFLKELSAYPYFKMENSQIKLKEERFLSQNKKENLKEAKECIKNNKNKKGITKLEKLAKNGSPEAMIELGIFYNEQYPLDAFNYFVLALITGSLLNSEDLIMWEEYINKIDLILKNNNQPIINTIMNDLENELKIISHEAFTATEKLGNLLNFYYSNFIDKNTIFNHPDYIDQQIFGIAKFCKDELLINEFVHHYYTKGLFERSASYLRLMKTPNALFNLGTLIKDYKINHDENNVFIEENKKLEVAARLYRRSKTSNALFNLAVLIQDDKINHDENNEEIKEDKRYEVVARLFLNSKTSKGLCFLGILIYYNKINHDENFNILEDKMRIEVVARLFRKSSTPMSYYGLAILELNKCRDGLTVKDELKLFKSAKKYALESLNLGYKDAAYFLEDIQKDIEKLTRNKNRKTEKNQNINSTDHSDHSDSSDSIEEDKSIQSVLPSTICKSNTQPVNLSTEQNNSHTTEFEDYLTPEYKEKRKKAKEIFSHLKSGKPLTLESLNPFNDNHQQKDLNTITWSKDALDQLSTLESKLIKKVNFLLDCYSQNDFSRGHYKPLTSHTDLYSARITQKDRLVIKKTGFHQYKVMQCGGHYND